MVKKFKTLSFTAVHKVFILPNNLGFYFLGLWATSFLLSVGYASNLLLFMAVVQFTLFLWWMVTAHTDTHQLKLKTFSIPAIFAKQDTSLNIEWNLANYSLNIKEIAIITNQQQVFHIHHHPYNKLQFSTRGKYQLDKLKIKLISGFYLFHTWKYLPLKQEIIVFPEPIEPPITHNSHQWSMDQSKGVKKDASIGPELDLQREVDSSTAPNRINWKRFSQKGNLVERYGENFFQQKRIFDLDQVTSELSLSYLTYQILETFHHNHSWQLKYKGQLIGPFNINEKNTGELHQCLKLLATHTW